MSQLKKQMPTPCFSLDVLDPFQEKIEKVENSEKNENPEKKQKRKSRKSHQLSGLCTQECGGHGNCLYYSIWESLNYMDMMLCFHKYSPMFSEYTRVQGPDSIQNLLSEPRISRKARMDSGVQTMRNLVSEHYIDQLKKEAENILPNKKNVSIGYLFLASLGLVKDTETIKTSLASIEKQLGFRLTPTVIKKLEKDDEYASKIIYRSIQNMNGIWGDRNALAILSRHLPAQLLVLSKETGPNYTRIDGSDGPIVIFQYCHVVDPADGVEMTPLTRQKTSDWEFAYPTILLFLNEKHYQVVGFEYENDRDTNQLGFLPITYIVPEKKLYKESCQELYGLCMNPPVQKRIKDFFLGTGKMSCNSKRV